MYPQRGMNDIGIAQGKSRSRIGALTVKQNAAVQGGTYD